MLWFLFFYCTMTTQKWLFFKYNRIIVLFHAKRVPVLFDLFIVLATGIDRFVLSRPFVWFKVSNNYVIYTFLLGYVWRSLDSSEEQLLLNINFLKAHWRACSVCMTHNTFEVTKFMSLKFPSYKNSNGWSVRFWYLVEVLEIWVFWDVNAVSTGKY